MCDRDLSGIAIYRGLSETAVSKVADDLSIPTCLYAQGMTGNVIERAQEWESRQIILDYSIGFYALAKQIKSIYFGFEFIRKSCKKALKARKASQTPAQLMAVILKRPELADRIALYGAGDQKNLAEVFRTKEEDEEQSFRRMSRMLGLWLWDSVLRFPGILLNEVAAASYLNIAPENFKSKPKIRECFDEAKYTGPFCEIQGFWWRDRLDEILYNSECDSGLNLVAKLHPRTSLEPCQCHFDRKTPAGYYCIVKEKPVCENHSKGNLSWFPAGADIARVTTDVYDELAPWIGLY